MADYSQPDYIDRRVRYFDGQFLKEQDFIDEQRYHLDRRRRLTRLLLTPGVLEGLEVAPVANAPRVKVAPGTAVDGRGRLLVRTDDTVPVELGDKVNRDGPVTIVIALSYNDVESDAPQGGASPRWREAPDVVAFLEGAPDAPPADTHLRLARVTLDSNGAVTVDPVAPAALAGVDVRGPLSVAGQAIFGNGVSGLSGAPLRVDGDAQVRGPIDFDSSTRLLVTNGSGDYGRTNLVLSGRFQDGNDAWTFGTGARNSIVFASNASASKQNVGAVGDEQQSIQLEGNSNTLGFLTRQRGVNPALVIRQDGAVGIGTTDPGATLAVAGDLAVTGAAAVGQIGNWTATMNKGFLDIHIAAGSDHNVICAQLASGSAIGAIRVYPPPGTEGQWVGRYAGLGSTQQILGEIGVMTLNADDLSLFANVQGHPLPPNSGVATRVIAEVHRVHVV